MFRTTSVGQKCLLVHYSRICQCSLVPKTRVKSEAVRRLNQAETTEAVNVAPPGETARSL